MSKIVVFKNLAEYFNYFKPKMVRVLGRGCEGVTYTDGDAAYKMYIYDYPQNREYRENVDKIITSEDYDLSSFAFPEILYLVNNLLMAIKLRYVSNDIFHNWKENKSIEILKSIDFDAFTNAYLKMLDDIKVLSRDKIYINDLNSKNLLFDGESLVAVDTCFYEADSNETEKHNIQKYNIAISSFFDFLIKNYPELKPYFGSDVSYQTDIVKGIEKVKYIIK